MNLLLHLLFAQVGIKYTASWPGKLALVLYSSPVFLWGTVQIGQALKDVRHHCSVWHSGKARAQILSENLLSALKSPHPTSLCF
jgi:hypothetical protein